MLRSERLKLVPRGEPQGADGAARPAPPTQPDLSPPERPKLAEGVKLAGQMQESAFKEPPWLIEREGSGYVQVTDVLYAIAERCDGEHTIEEIAKEVTEKTGETLGAESVQRLVVGQLIARGLVETADGKSMDVPQARSLLAINFRMKMLSPRLIDPVTAVLKVLFWPPVLLPVLGFVVLGQAWLYYVHGIAGGLREALYAPALMVPLLGAIVLGAAFHEFGHASALRYGGGRVKGMGAGLYLAYPAFYTDVSDNYRLKRWGRVRTDLGGVYFNLVMVGALLGAYAATRAEILLLVVLLINFEIVHQLLPFVRLDGYWLLADVTGVPDFFSQMGAFWRSVLPVKETAGRKLPELKWWGKVVFLAYTALAVPVLALLLFLMVRSVPRVLGTAWDSAAKQLEGMRAAQAAGDGLGVVGGVGQLALLALPVVGLVYAMFLMAKGARGLIVRWSAGSALKRTVGSAAAGALAAGVAMLWLPHVPVVNAPGPLYRPSSFEPIRPEERFVVRDVAPGVAAKVDPVLVARGIPVPSATAASGTATAAPGPTGAAGSVGAAQPTATSAVRVATAAPGGVGPIVATPTRVAAAATPVATPAGTRVATSTVATPVSTGAARPTSTATRVTATATIVR